MMGLRELLADQTLSEVPLGNMTLDSRDVQPNMIFIAVPGAERDGRDFIHAALEQGAGVVLAEADGRELPHDHRVIAIADLKDQIGVLADRFYRSASCHLKVMAVTGTNGKTSIVELTRQLLQAVGLKAGSIGTLGSRLFGPPTEVRNTTPDCITLHRQLRVWRDAGVDYVAMEASSHALDQRRLDGLKIDVAVFTNLSRDHLDYHHSMEAYAESKFKLFRDFASSVQIYNADDSLLSSQSDIWGPDSVGISFTDESADVLIGMISVAPLAFTLRTPWGDAQIDSLLAGRFNAFNLTVAIVATASMGVPLAEVIAVTNQLKPVPGRLELMEMPSDITVVIDYAHTPDALHRAITAVSEAQHQGCIWVLFGCGGDRDRGKRSEMGAVAARLADRIVVTSDNPRGEPPEAIIQDILAGCEGAAPLVEVDRATAISLVIAEAAAGDTVLIAGKGHETYQEIAGARIPFSDVQCANHYLAQRRAA
jgi:UDP-N-acetylmuramoyl-L-alanyl-D-glutamate--2,6-diaminopimelate ligase